VNQVPGDGILTIRLWAAAKHAAGTGQVQLPAGLTIEQVRNSLSEQFGDALGQVLSNCSVLINGQQCADEFRQLDVATIEFLPPFAGG
jgi:sulfur-carrier protein